MFFSFSFFFSFILPIIFLPCRIVSLSPFFLCFAFLFFLVPILKGKHYGVGIIRVASWAFFHMLIGMVEPTTSFSPFSFVRLLACG